MIVNTREALYSRRALFVLTLLLAAALIFCVSCSNKLIGVSSDDTPIKTGSDGELSYIIYQKANGKSYVSLLEFNAAESSKYITSDKSGFTLTLPSLIEELPVTRLEDNFYSGTESNISRIVLPESLEYIGNGAISQCPSVTQIEIPDSVSYIGQYALHKSAWLDNQTEEFVIVGDGVLVDYNGDGGEITLPRAVRMITTAFARDCGITSLKVNRGCREIISRAFEKSELVSVELPSTLKTLGSFAFASCASLESLSLPDGCEPGRCALVECDKLVLRVKRGGSSMRYAIERNIPFTFDGKILHTSEEFPALSPYGELTFNYSTGFGVGKYGTDATVTYKTDETNAFYSGDGRLAILQSSREDGAFDKLIIADLRTARVIAEQTVDTELILSAAGYDEADPEDFVSDGSLVVQGWDEHGFVFTCTATLTRADQAASEVEQLTFSARRETVYDQTSTFNLRSGISSLPDSPQFLEGYTAITSSADKSATLYSLTDANGNPTDELMLSWTYGTVGFKPESIHFGRIPTLQLADIDLDGRRDVVMIYSGQYGAQQLEERVEIFYGPTGLRRESLNPTADAQKLVSIAKNGRSWSIASPNEALEAARKNYGFGASPDELSIGGYTTCSLIGNRICANVGMRSYSYITPLGATVVYGFERGASDLDADNAKLLEPLYIGLRGENDTTSADKVFAIEDLEFEDLEFEDLELDGIRLYFASDLCVLLDNDGVTTQFLRDKSRRNVSPDGIALYEYDLDGSGENDLLLALSHGSEMLIKYAEKNETLTLLADEYERDCEIVPQIEYHPQETGLTSWRIIDSFGERIIDDAEFYRASDETVRVVMRFGVDDLGLFATQETVRAAADCAKQYAKLRLAVENSQLKAISYEILEHSFAELELTSAEVADYFDNDRFTAELTKITITDAPDSGYSEEMSITARKLPDDFAEYEPSGDLFITRISKSALENPIFADEIKTAQLLRGVNASALTLADRAVIFADTSNGAPAIVERMSPDADGFTSRFYIEDGRLLCEYTNAAEPPEILAKLTGRANPGRIIGEVRIKNDAIELTGELVESISEILDLDAQLAEYKDNFEGINTLDELIAQNLGGRAVKLTRAELEAELESMRALSSQGGSELSAIELSDLPGTHLTLEARSGTIILRELTARGKSIAPEHRFTIDADSTLSITEVGELTVISAASERISDNIIIGSDGIFELYESIYTDRVLTYLEAEADRLAYRRINSKYTSGIDSGLAFITARDELFSEHGYVSFADGQLELTPDPAQPSATVSDAAELDLLFAEQQPQKFSDFESLDDLIEHNVAAEHEFAAADRLSLRVDRHSGALVLRVREDTSDDASAAYTEYRYSASEAAFAKARGIDFDPLYVEQCRLYSSDKYALIIYRDFGTADSVTSFNAAVIDTTNGDVLAVSDMTIAKMLGQSTSAADYLSGAITLDCIVSSTSPISLEFTLTVDETVMASAYRSFSSDGFN